MPKTVLLKIFGKFIYNKKLNAYKLFKEEIEYYFSADNKKNSKK